MCIIALLYVTVDVGNVFLHLSDMLDFDGTETPLKLILNFLRQYSSGFFFYSFRQWNPSVLNCIALEMYFTLCFSRLPHNRLNWSKWLQWCHAPIHTTIGLASFESFNCRWSCPAVSIISKQRLQTVLNDLFFSCHACLRVERGHF